MVESGQETKTRMGHDRGMTARWGVAGRAPVADKVLRDLAHVPNAVLTAVGSRSAERAEAFAGPAVGCAGGRIDERLGVSGFFLGSAELHVDGVSASITKLSYLVNMNQFPLVLRGLLLCPWLDLCPWLTFIPWPTPRKSTASP